MKCYLIIGLLIGFHAGAWAQNRTVDHARSYIGFKIRNAGIGVDGHFNEYSVSIVFDPQAPAQARFDGKIKVGSIDTGIGARDNHLKKDDYFDATKFPDMQFHSTAVKAQGSGYAVYGRLTIKDVTREVSIPVTVTKEQGLEIFSGQLTIDRTDYHVGEDSWIMADDVLITIKIATQ